MAFTMAMAAGSTSTLRPRSGGDAGAWVGCCCCWASAVDTDNAVATTLATNMIFIRCSPETGRMIDIFCNGRNRGASVRARPRDQARARLESCIGPHPIEQDDE